VPGEGEFRLSEPPSGTPMTPGPERPEEFSPGLPPDLKQMAEQMAAMAESVAATVR
jgi:Mn-containing catalase